MHKNLGRLPLLLNKKSLLIVIRKCILMIASMIVKNMRKNEFLYKCNEKVIVQHIIHN